MNIEVLVTAEELSVALGSVAAWADDIHVTYAWASSKQGTAAHWKSVIDRIRRAVIGIHFAQTEPYALRELHRRKVVRVVEDTEGVFHPKLLIATKGEEARVLMGSSNFTTGGFETNTEVNVLLQGLVSEPTVVKLFSFVDMLWSRSRVPDDAWLDHYDELYNARPKPPPAPPKLAAPASALVADHRTSMVSFVDGPGLTVHDQFQTWRRTHPHGYFLNFASRTKARLHVSDCHHSGSTEWTPDDFHKSLTRSRKVCAEDEKDLLTWAKEDGLSIQSCDCSRNLVE